MTPAAREAVARKFEEILSRRHPGVSFSVPFSVPDVGPQAEATSRSGEVVRSLAAPEHERALGDRHAAATDEHGIEGGVQ